MLGTIDRRLQSRDARDLSVLLLEDNKFFQDRVLRALYAQHTHASRSELENVAVTHPSEEVRCMANFGLISSLKIAERRRSKGWRSASSLLKSRVPQKSPESWDIALSTRSVRKKLYRLVWTYCDERGERASEREVDFILWVVDWDMQWTPLWFLRELISTAILSWTVTISLGLGLAIPLSVCLSVVAGLIFVTIRAWIQYHRVDGWMRAAREARDRWTKRID